MSRKKKAQRRSETVKGPFGDLKRFSVSTSKGNFNKDIWSVESYGSSTEREATEFAREVWGTERAEVRNMVPVQGAHLGPFCSPPLERIQIFSGRVFGISGFPKNW